MLTNATISGARKPSGPITITNTTIGGARKAAGTITMLTNTTKGGARMPPATITMPPGPIALIQSHWTQNVLVHFML